MPMKWHDYPWSAKYPLEVGQKELAALPSEKRIEIESRYHRIEQLFKDHEYGKVIEEADIILTDLPDGFFYKGT